MKKINLLLSHQYRNAFNNYWIINYLHSYFNVIFIEDNPTFNKSNTVIMFGDRNDLNYIIPYQEQGYKIVYEHVWNSGPAEPIAGSMLLTNVNWFWYSEALYYLSIATEQYQPNKTYKKLALMPMWHRKPHRELLINHLSDLLDRMIYSYAINGIFLPNDEVFSSSRYNHFNPEWYNDTHFSIVAETEIRPEPEWFMLSEKTYKPFAFYHPFVMVGQAGMLKHLRSQGFETFGNLFDENYDLELDFDIRFAKTIKTIRDYQPRPYDSITLDKLQHNHNLFFNTEIILHKLVAEVINPIINFAETS